MLGLEARAYPDGTIALAPAGDDRELVLLEVDADAHSPPADATGLYHVALLLPDRAALARAFRGIEAAGGRRYMVGAADHLVSEALYYADPEGNGLELYADRSRNEWRWEEGELVMGTEPLDLRGLLAKEQAGVDEGPPIGPGTVVGHVHLQVARLERTAAFYRERLGMRVTVSGYPGALFLSWSGYHHHLGMNVWGARVRVPQPPGARGLIGWEVRFPTAVGARLPGDVLELTDPDGVRVRVVGAE